MHTSPLAQPGTGDGGGMNVYVKELATALSRAGVACDVYTRADDDVPAIVDVEPGFRLHHIAAGPLAPVPRHELPELVDAFTDGVLARMQTGHPAEAIHANYWLSGVAGHRIKHALDLPLVSTFHTLDRVKAQIDVSDDGVLRSQSEAAVIGCSDAIVANCDDEVRQLVHLYGADATRIEVVPLGVDHAFFGPNPTRLADGRVNRRQARRAIGFDEDSPMLLFVGRIQPLKNADVAICTLASLDAHPDAHLVIVGGPSGTDGEGEVARLHKLVVDLGLGGRVTFVAPQPHELLSTFYRAAEVCLVPSRSESFGLVALEAKACGTPVVAADVGGLSTLVDDGGTGFLIETHDPADFARATARILGEPGLAAELSVNAARRAAGYTWSIAAARLRRLYADLTARTLVECP
jgi:D-inositol-3-phosphate glycosyltransferase